MATFLVLKSFIYPSTFLGSVCFIFTAVVVWVMETEGRWSMTNRCADLTPEYSSQIVRQYCSCYSS